MLLFTTDRPASLTTREGLADYLTNPFPRPDLMTREDYAALTESQRAEYNHARIRYASGHIVVNTPDLIAATKLLAQCMQVNVWRTSGHAGLMLSGDSTLGKTESTKALMRYTHHHFAKAHPDYADHDWIPVVYISVPAASTGKLLMKAFADFLGLPVKDRESMGDIRNRVVGALAAARTQLIVVDELQNLAGRSVGLGESVDVLKNLHNEVHATFVYAGIDLSSSLVLSGTRGQQLRGRFSIHEMERLTLSDPVHRKVWKGLLNAFEKELPLHGHPVGTLRAMSDYLYERTAGSIGSLSRLLTGATIELIITGAEETLTQSVLDAQILDRRAEELRTQRTSRGRRRGSDYLTVAAASA